MVSAPATEEGEDPRWKRSNTDCVFFLVSNFTCTKGSKCEYRHCEGARFNLRNCRYWFHGNWVNPSCTFRHPPLENLNRTKSLADPPSSCGSTPFKIASRCYFYFNSSCIKGDRCPFLHELLTPNTAVGISSEAATLNPAGNEKSSGDEMVEASKDAHTNHRHDTSYHMKKHQSKEVPESSNPEFDGAIFGALGTSMDTDECMKSPMLSDQSSGHSTMDHTEHDEWCESSPEFDVLVGDGLCNMNDLERQLAQERDAKILPAKYDVGDPACCDLDYYDSEYYGQAFCDFADQHGYFYRDHHEGIQEYDRDTTLGHMPRNGSKLVRSTSDEYEKMLVYPGNFINSGADVGFVQQYTQVRRTSKRRPERRCSKGKKGRKKRRRGLESRSGFEAIESRTTVCRSGNLIEECPQPVVRSTFRGQKKKIREKQHRVLSARSSEHPTANFTGPKTLAQIKEDKCISKPSFGHSTACTISYSDDFVGRKSLTDLLEAKGSKCVCEIANDEVSSQLGSKSMGRAVTTFCLDF